MRIPFADGHLACDDVGSGVPVVLLHDGTLDRRVFAEQLHALPGYRVLNLDARGHGESSTPSSPYQRADDVIALLDHLDLPAAFLVGQAMGGTTALDVALDHPERVLGAVLSGCGTSQQYWQSPFIVDLLAQQAAAATRLDTAGYVEAYLRMWVDGPARRPADVDPEVRERCREMALHTATRHARPDPVFPGRAADSWARLPSIDVAVVAVVGELDCADVREMAERVVAAVPGARLEAVPATGHMVTMERPRWFTDVVRRFLLDAVGQPAE